MRFLGDRLRGNPQPVKHEGAQEAVHRAIEGILHRDPRWSLVRLHGPEREIFRTTAKIERLELDGPQTDKEGNVTANKRIKWLLKQEQLHGHLESHITTRMGDHVGNLVTTVHKIAETSGAHRAAGTIARAIAPQRA